MTSAPGRPGGLAAVRARLRDSPSDAGNALVEFLGVSIVLLIPVIYLVLVLAQVQAATFAVDGAAREAARAFITAGPDEDPGARAVAAVALALGDQGLDPALASDSLTVRCPTATCLEPGGTVTAVVDVQVKLVGVPDMVSRAVPLVVPVSASATVPVDRYASRR